MCFRDLRDSNTGLDSGLVPLGKVNDRLRVIAFHGYNELK